MIGQKSVANLISDCLKSKLSLEKAAAEIEAVLELPKDSSLGDLAFPCFQLSKTLKRPPIAIATELAAVIQEILTPGGEIQKVQATGPYLNFFLNKASLAGVVVNSVLSGLFLARRDSKKERVMVEYGNVNTHKSLHVGHVRNAALGDSIARMYEWSGYDTIRSNYLGDEGTHVAKCLWYLTKHPELTVPSTNRLEFLGGLYSKATLQLDLEIYTRVPIRGVISARVEGIAPHPTEEAWVVVTLHTVKGQVAVVTQKKNAQHLKLGTIVPHATPGSNLGARAIGIADKKGVQSHGLLVGNEELGLGTGNEVLSLEIPERLTEQYPDGVGVEMIELYRIPASLPGTLSILEQVTQWNREVSEVLKGLEGASPELKKVWEDTRQWSVNEIKSEFGWLNCSFDHFFLESEYGETSKELVREYQKKGVFVESEGAVGADLQSMGLGFCLLIKRDGTALYATRDLELAKKKFEQFHIDRSIYVVDAAQTLHFQQVFKCLELMGYEQVAKCFHCSYAQVVLPDGKMSSRKGNVILMSQLKERLLSKIESEFLGKYRGDWPDAELDETARRIALGTMRYGMLNQDNQSMIVFDLDAWTARTGNTGPYMMYAYARTRSILREIGENARDWTKVDWSLLSHETEAEVLRHLNEYHSTVALATERHSPHTLCAYVYELAKLFSRMYKQCSVLHAESEELKTARAGLVNATGLVIQHGLSLLGIQTVERM